MKVGVAVTLTGLKRSDLNGRRGYLCGPQSLTTAGRWPVQLTSSHAGWHDADLACKRLLVREENLVAAPAADALIESLLTERESGLPALYPGPARDRSAAWRGGGRGMPVARAVSG